MKFQNMGEVMAALGQSITAFSAVILRGEQSAIKATADEMKGIVSITTSMAVNSGMNDDDIMSVVGVAKFIADGVMLVEEAIEKGQTIGDEMVAGWTMLGAQAVILSNRQQFRATKVPELDEKSSERTTKYLMGLIPEDKRADAERLVALHKAGDDPHEKVGTLH